MKSITLHRIFVVALLLSSFIGFSAQGQSDDTELDAESDSVCEFTLRPGGDSTLIIRPPERPFDTIPLLPRDTIPDTIPDLPGVSNIDSLHVDPEKPDIPKNTSKIPVGNFSGSLTVSNTGAANYNIPVMLPDGGGLAPSIALSYTSHNCTYGLAGYGFSVSGISSITRGGKNLYNNNGIVRGITYTPEDNLYLDGKRLVLISGEACQEGAIYSLEGDPYIQIIAHGVYNNSTADTWFEVKTTDGKTYHYGNGGNSQISYKNSNGNARIASWYVNYVEDKYANYISYQYTIRNLYAYPTSITYGMNAVKSRGIVNKVAFEYENLRNKSAVFNIEDQKGEIDQCLSSITTSTNESVFRKYILTYNRSYDENKCKTTRLSSVEEQNGEGEKLRPVNLYWHPLPGDYIYYSDINTTTSTDQNFVVEQDKKFLAADLNGDGISDIIRISPVKIITSIGPGSEDSSYKTHVYINMSNVSPSGDVTYSYPLVYTLQPSMSLGDMSSIIGGASLLDFDGDGFNDLIIPYHGLYNGVYIEDFYVIYGSDNSSGSGGDIKLFSWAARKEAPLFLPFDTDMDGKDEVIRVEKTLENNSYKAFVKKFVHRDSIGQSAFTIKLPSTPQKLFCGDYNNDGLTDIILLHNGGYKIYYNNGGAESDIKFTESNSKTGTNLSDQWRVVQGDFDGDGLIDFVYNVKGESRLWIARNNGNGTFTCSQTGDIGVVDIKKTGKDDNRFSLVVYDIDHDGKSDAAICKAQYDGSKFTGTHVKWFFSDGSTLRPGRSSVKQRENDANESSIFLGDFNGDGYVELANYGSVLTSISDTFTENKLHVYQTSVGPYTGRLCTIYDGMNNATNIEYSSTTDPTVYTRTAASQYPVNTYTLPIAVVKSVNSKKGIYRYQTNHYSYKDFKIHMRGAGVLGFSSFTNDNKTTGETATTAVTKWDMERMIPLETKTTKILGGKTSISTSTNTVEDINGTYFSYESALDVTDYDGNRVVTTSQYDTGKGVIVEQSVKNDGDNMYKKVAYTGYQKKSGVWLPTSMTMTQKHEHDDSPYSTEIRYEYDDKGNILSTTNHYGTPLALTTSATYDDYGNCLSSVSTGAGVKPITSYNEYDASGRFMVKTYMKPSCITKTYAYDTWGNLLKEKDISNPSDSLVTTNVYDNWGRLISSTAPDGTVSKTTMGWGYGYDEYYYILHEQSGAPWVLSWYDSGGYEVLTETFGPCNVRVAKETSYNSQGKVSRTESVNGRLSVTEEITYDKFGRVQTDKLSTGSSVSYSYGNRSVTTSTNGRTYTKTTDAWGNVLTSTDPSGGVVSYTYNSNGLPSAITSNGSTVSISYDEAGNRTSLTDPDAGTSTYEYSADGKVLRQTDARGVVTVNTYDNLQRLTKVQVGNSNIENTYGTSGREQLHLLSSRLDKKTTHEYSYDNLGRIRLERHLTTAAGGAVVPKIIHYGEYSKISKIVHNGVHIIYGYDKYGFRTSIALREDTIFRLLDYDGRTCKVAFADSIVHTVEYDEAGFESLRYLSVGDKIVENLDLRFDHANGNLISRQRNSKPKETFRYDNLDRLVAIKKGYGYGEFQIDYEQNGNIAYKSDIGTYSYNSDFKPHAVMGVDNDSGIIPSEKLSTTFNDLGRIQTIEDESSGYSMRFEYFSDKQRAMSVLSKDGVDVRTTIYLGNCERVIENGVTRNIHYLDEGLIVVRDADGVRPYLSFTDNLGSILAVYDTAGKKVFDASYDAWGQQTVELNTIGISRGYTGHEMLSEFGIINMNGRLYDPLLGRFFSPDNYVQLPDFAQSYNRYSYCLNNPLKYTDPSGELFGIDDAVFAFAAFNVASSMMQAAANGQNIWKAGAFSLLSSAASFGIGQLFGSVGSIGKELLRAGAHGIASGIFNVLGGGDFGNGFAAGATASGLGSFAQGVKMRPGMMVLTTSVAGGVAAWATGGNFLKGALQGLTIGFFNHGAHSELYIDSEGNLHGHLRQVICYGTREKKVPVKDILGAAAVMNTVIDEYGSSLKNYGGNSSYASNGYIYYYSKNEHGFYGNKYVKTVKLTTIGSQIRNYTSKIGTGFNLIEVGSGLHQDYKDYQKSGEFHLYHGFRAGASWAGAYYGAMAGAKIGAAIGVWFDGVGAGPGIIIGGFIGGFFGSFGGSEVGQETIDLIYGI